MSDTIQALLNLAYVPELNLGYIPEFNLPSPILEQIPTIYPNQLVYSPIIKSIKSRLLDKNKIFKFEFRDKGKKVKKIKI
jgi:hypothetical protein